MKNKRLPGESFVPEVDILVPQKTVNPFKVLAVKLRETVKAWVRPTTELEKVLRKR